MSEDCHEINVEFTGIIVPATRRLDFVHVETNIYCADGYEIVRQPVVAFGVYEYVYRDKDGFEASACDVCGANEQLTPRTRFVAPMVEIHPGAIDEWQTQVGAEPIGLFAPREEPDDFDIKAAVAAWKGRTNDERR
jgi:hypothetical protein